MTFSAVYRIQRDGALDGSGLVWWPKSGVKMGSSSPAPMWRRNRRYVRMNDASLEPFDASHASPSCQSRPDAKLRRLRKQFERSALVGQHRLNAVDDVIGISL